MRTLQIGIMGSAADLEYSKDAEEIAERIGQLVAKSGNTIVFGAEKDCDSLSTAAARGAKRVDGTTIGITYNKGKKIFDPDCADFIIATGSDRGGGREFVLVNSCDAIISVSGGSGTLTELAVAYQSGIPIVCLTGFGGWSDRLAGTFLDRREREQCICAATAEEAVKLALEEGKKYLKRTTDLG
jgi:uncharacterized protein (TIGR00725 family)